MPLYIEILTLFPEYFRSPFAETMLAKAIDKGVVNLEAVNIRDFTTDKHRQCDDAPFGGGAGMVMKPEPVVAAIEASRQKSSSWVVLLSPQGRVFNQNTAEELLAKNKKIVLVCGRYEGIDHRVREYIDDEISIGDFVLSGGEPAALVVIDTLYRLVPNALGNEESVKEESFCGPILEYPQFTRPREFRGSKAPEVLFSGNHGEIAKWRELAALSFTRRFRPDLFDKYEINDKKTAELDAWENENEYANTKI